MFFYNIQTRVGPPSRISPTNGNDLDVQHFVQISPKFTFGSLVEFEIKFCADQ